MKNSQSLFVSAGESRQLDLGSGLFIGGLPWQHFVDEKFSVLIWSGVLKRGFVGCIRELILNDEAVDMVHYAEEQDIGEGNNENYILINFLESLFGNYQFNFCAQYRIYRASMSN